jgi:hypothetical protein
MEVTVIESRAQDSNEYLAGADIRDGNLFNSNEVL